MQRKSFVTAFFFIMGTVAWNSAIPVSSAATEIRPPPTRIEYRTPVRSSRSFPSRYRRRRMNSTRPSRRSIIKLGDPGSPLGSIRFSGIDAPVFIRSFSVLIEGRSASGNPFDPEEDRVRDMLANVKLVNERTGRSVQGRALSQAVDEGVDSSRAYQIYNFRSFEINGTDELLLTIRTKNRGPGTHPMRGDRFRLVACTNADSGCLFSGILNQRDTRHRLEAEVFWRR